MTEKYCEDCDHYELRHDEFPCNDCVKLYGVNDHFVDSRPTLETINDKLDKIMDHLGIPR